MKVTGNTILITGGTSGIGRALALRLHEAGNKVIVTGRRKELLQEIAADHPGIDTLVLDITDPVSITVAAETLATSHPQLNVLINNAGIMLPESVFNSGSLQVAEDTVATNLLGPLRMTYALLPQLVNKVDATIINVTTGLAFVPLPITATYNATKAALHSFTESLRVQLADTSVQVIELIPPSVRTTLMGQQDDEEATPVDEFVTEAVDRLGVRPHANEIVIGQRAQFLRTAEASGRYDQVLAMLSQR